ncbi:polyphosphate polymerase domain-containing protein [Flavivirga jejuensis]|uniref:Polyphosphate polymerase domain-containing protein n=1 Tax=Flavivirga jejuensis TaxID=870487 RepID=A0ABT8WKR3_9FLAO|nr:polyphosphate polymerase domain-containing protein [Flavivirga jejuensis]MDO5973738.1 polyphosphate polymerase domain-containing protein [Flavivirga jejuensis]
MQHSIEKNISMFSPISLKEMNSVALMKRTDTKFVIHKSQLILILENIQNDYKVLEIEKNRIMTYSSLYFDTNEVKFYKDHHNGKNNRTKIRIRKYVESDLCFLEIKQKNGKGQTTKSRTTINDFETDLSKNSIDFITAATSKTYNLSPTLWNDFNRMTLVNISFNERVTIDLNIHYTMGKAEKTYDDLVIIEVKQESFNRNSPIVKILKSFQYHPYSISKYCIGMVNLHTGLKYNRFKEKINKINKIIN